ncbi:MAG TPA: hypothetical protein ENK07_06990, partial [Bacteroidetes bacterium]|nr:hypothetical protein [Bacteroidota bacterium]
MHFWRRFNRAAPGKSTSLLGCLALWLLAILLLTSCARRNPSLGKIVKVADGWAAELVAQVDQSYAGWDVEIGD